MTTRRVDRPVALGAARNSTPLSEAEAHDQAVEAVLGWVQDHAHTRIRQHGHVMCVDTDGIVVAMFRQHTSRKLDPQLHTHAVISNRVIGRDGRWLALDARTIKLDQRTLSALYHANLRSELTRRLSVQWRQPENGIAEIAAIDDEVLAEFSQRTTDIQRRLDEKLGRFRRRLGRDPTESERWVMEREAVVDSRPPKPHGITAADLRYEWRQRVMGLGRNPAGIVQGLIGRQRRLQGVDGDRAEAMLDQALDSLAERQSTWRPAELVRELAATTPTMISVESGRLTDFLQRVADLGTDTRCVDISRFAPSGVAVRRDGRPVTEPAVHRVLTTQAILDEEEQILTWAEQHRR